MTSKLDLVADRVAQLQAAQATQDMHVGGGISARALLQSIVRIVQDNERIQAEVTEKQQDVDKMRDQVQSLLDRNQKLVEEVCISH